MITDAIYAFFTQMVIDLLSLLPDVQVPDWLEGVTGPLSTVLGYASSLGAWYPTELLKNVAIAVVAAHGAAMAIKVVRILLSFLTAGGGSAA